MSHIDLRPLPTVPSWQVYATAGWRNAELVTDTFGATHFVDYKAEHWWEKWAVRWMAD